MRRLWGPLAHGGQPQAAGARQALLAVLIAAFALRLGAAIALPSIHHADEIYQVGEQAFRAVHGYGIEPWEFRIAARPALLPTLVEPIYRLDVSARTHRLLQSALFSALSLIPVWVAFEWGRRLYGVAGAVLSAAVMAIWFELVYFAPKATADAVASYPLLLALYLARPMARSSAAFGAGLSLTLALALRIQIAPAIGLALLLAWAAGRARWLALGGGVAAGLLAAGIVEWRWWGVPFQGQIGYLTMEFTHHASRYFAQEPITFFVKQYLLMYGAATPVIAFLVYWGARTAPVLLVAAVAVILPFHVVGHKEYRFIVAALPMIVLLMGLGAADVMSRLGLATNRRVLATTIAGWLVGMVAVSWGDTYRPLWTRHGNHIRAFELVGREADACGIGLVGIRWWQVPGYSGLGRNVPIYEIRNDSERQRLLRASNYVVEATKAPPPPPPYERWREFTRPLQYVYKRPGGCVPAPDAQVVYPPGIPGLELERRDVQGAPARTSSDNR